MSVIDSIKRALGGSGGGVEPDGSYRCGFCDGEFGTAYSFCPDCGSERIEKVG